MIDKYKYYIVFLDGFDLTLEGGLADISNQFVAAVGQHGAPRSLICLAMEFVSVGSPNVVDNVVDNQG
jgi:hypothetical protein